MGSSESQLCVCGHVRDAHEHYRRGSDCGRCGALVCGQFRAVGSVGTRLRRLLGLEHTAAPLVRPRLVLVPGGLAARGLSCAG